jgi:hypothetical protein
MLKPLLAALVCGGTAVSGSVMAGEAIVSWGDPVPQSGPLGDGSRFGDAVAFDGRTAAISLPGRYPWPEVRIFQEHDGAWIEQERLRASGSLAIDDGVLLIGRGDSDRCSGGGGAANVFVEVSGSWTLVSQLCNPHPDRGSMGEVVALDGDTAVVSGYRVTRGVRTIYVFRRDRSGWTLEAELLPPDIAVANAFGRSISIDGDTILVGDPIDIDGFSQPGAAYVFVRDAGAWTFQAKLEPPASKLGTRFGFSVAVDADTALIGAPRDDQAGRWAGAVYAFERTGENWFSGERLVVTGDRLFLQLGHSIALDGNVAIVGAKAPRAGAGDSGTAYLFTSRQGRWATEERSELVMLTPDWYAPNFALEYSRSVAVNGTIAWIGAPHDDWDWCCRRSYMAGSAHVFDLPSDLLHGLHLRVERSELDVRTTRQLQATLEQALQIVEDDVPANDSAAIPIVERFKRHVETLRGAPLSESEADALENGADGVVDLLYE